MRVSYSPGYIAPLPEGHVFPMKKFSGLYKHLVTRRIIEPHHVIEPGMTDFSIHGAKNYPFVKPPSTFDIGLDDGTEDNDYLMALDKALDKILSEFTPDLVYYLAGIDTLKTDHFGRLALTLRGLKERERLVIERITKKNIPAVLLLSGGYAPSLNETVEAHAILFEAAKDISTTLFH